MQKKRIGSAACAAMMLAVTAQAVPFTHAAAAIGDIYEFEGGVISGCDPNEPIAWSQIDEDGFGNTCDMTGFSGEGYVYLGQKDSYVSVTVEVEEAGFYGLSLNYIQCFGTPDNPNKIQYLYVNGESQGDVSFPFNSGDGWTLLNAGYIHLNAGENEIRMVSYWGYTFFDYLVLTEAPSYITALSPTQTLCDPNATPEAQKLYAYLTSVYGTHILSGQQEYCGSHCYNKNAYEVEGKPINYLESNEQEFTYIEEQTGKQPAVRGIDFLFYNTTEPYYDDAPERVIAWYKDKGGIPTVTYHWNVPTDGKDSTKAAFYVESTGNTPYTTFSITNALKSGTWEHEKIDADIAILAQQFGKIQDAGVPVIFRPLHEAEGAWFWWGAEGAEPCVALYHYLYQQLTETYGIHNLIWEWTSYTYATSPDWYPGDAYVDIVSYDKYNAVNYQPNESAISATFYSLVAFTEGQKMVAMSENDTIPSLDNLLEANAGWLYFCPWYGNYLTDLTSKTELNKIYNSEYCITLDELPDWDTYDPEIVTTAPKEDGGVMLGDADVNGKVELTDAVLICRTAAGDSSAALSVQGRINADCSGDGKINEADVLRLLRYLAGRISVAEFLGIE